MLPDNGSVNPEQSGSSESGEADLEQLFKAPQLSEREQQLAMQNQFLQQQAANLAYANQQAELRQLDAEISRLPYDQQQQAKAALQVYAYINQVQQQAATAEARAKSIENAALPLIRDRALSELSSRAKIERELIEKHAQTPQEARAVASALIEYRKGQNLSARQQAGMDSFPSGRGQSGGGMLRPGNDEVKNKYIGTGRIADYIREARRAGTW